MLNKDKEYILWLCKRLVYRYNEDPQILLNVESILEKNQTEIGFYRKTHNEINCSIESAIENLDKIRSSYKTSAQNTQKTYLEKKINQINTTFENLDIKKIMS